MCLHERLAAIFVHDAWYRNVTMEKTQVTLLRHSLIRWQVYICCVRKWPHCWHLYRMWSKQGAKSSIRQGYGHSNDSLTSQDDKPHRQPQKHLALHGGQVHCFSFIFWTLNYVFYIQTLSLSRHLETNVINWEFVSGQTGVNLCHFVCHHMTKTKIMKIYKSGFA